MSSLVKRFTSNAGANIIGGIGTAIYNLLLPSLVVHRLSAEDFSVWSLGIQVIIYIQVLGFGIQTAIARFVSADNETKNKEGVFLTVIAAQKIIRTLVILGALFSLLLVFAYPLFFHGLNHNSVVVLRYCILAFGLSSSIQLLSLLPIGFFTGLHKNYIHVVAMLFGRIISIIIIYLLIKTNADITILSVGLSVGLVIPSGILVYLMNSSRLLTKENVTETQVYGRKQELISYCKVLAVWGFCMLFVNGFQPFIAGYFDVKNVGVYSLAFTLIMVMVGLQQAIMAPILTIGSALWGKGEKEKIFNLYKISTIACCGILFFSIVFLFFFGRILISLWVGNAYALNVYNIVMFLALGNAIRNILSPYSLLLISIGSHRKAYLPAIIEAFSIVTLCSVLGYKHGINGVAYGAVFASILAISANAIITFKYASYFNGNKFTIYIKYVFSPCLVMLSIFFCLKLFFVGY